MKRALIIPLMLAAGLATGGGAAFGVATVTGPREAPEKEAAPMPTFVATGPILVPLVDSDGGLAGYGTIEVQLEVAADTKEDVASRLPLLLNAINLRTYRAPLASGPDRLLPDLAAFRQLVFVAAVETYGKGTVSRVAITSAKPA